MHEIFWIIQFVVDLGLLGLLVFGLLRRGKGEDHGLESFDRRLRALEEGMLRVLESTTPVEASGPRGFTGRTPSPLSFTPGDAPWESDRYLRVCALAEAGKGVDEIARETHLSKGEVDLILGLRPQRTAARY